nr:hypothetical protein [uncultured Cellulosilyticum sp.]
MNTDKITTNLEYRIIEREGDKDYFIETDFYPVNMELRIPGMSRFQFPLSRAILVRTTPCNDWITIHVLRDVDLFSSFVNFEVDLSGKKLNIIKEEGYIKLDIQSLPNAL